MPRRHEKWSIHMKTSKRAGLVSVLLLSGGLAAAGLGLGAGTAAADPGSGLGGILGGGGGGAGGLLSKVDELAPIIDAVKADPKGMISAVLDNPSDVIGLLGG
jgi:hypothetical protein